MFFLEYLRHPKSVGALAPSSKKLAKKMVQPIDFADCKCIVEYGPGTGVFTEEIIARKNPETIFLSIEQNENLWKGLKEKYRDIPNVHLIHGDAAKLKEYLHEFHQTHVDYIVSGLPFTSLPKEVSENIFQTTKQVIGKKGKFITFQYTLIKKKMFLRWFRLGKTRFELCNFPPAFVLVMKNKRETNSN